MRLIVLLITIVFFWLAEPRFHTLDNVSNVVLQISLEALLACGMATVMLAGGLDLSIGAVTALSGVVFVLVWPAGMFLAGCCALLSGLIAGVVNGFLVAHVRLNPIMVTLGAMASIQGLALWLSRGYPIAGPGGEFEMLGGGRFCYIPLPVIYAAVTFGAWNYLLRSTQFGRDLYVLGGNRLLSSVVSIPVVSREFLTYCISGVLAAFSGMVLASRLNTGSPIIGQDAPLEAIVAVVLGGASLSGGGRAAQVGP